MEEDTIDQHLIAYKDQTDKGLPEVLKVQIISVEPIKYLVLSHDNERFRQDEELTNKEIDNSDLVKKLLAFGLRHLKCKKEDNIIQVYYKEN